MFFISSFISLGSSYFIYYCMTAQRDYASLLLASPLFLIHTERDLMPLSGLVSFYPPISFYSCRALY